MSYTFRPAVRENTPLIIGIAGPTKSGKTMSALRVATGLAHGGKIAMINAEGLRGHQYADSFKYVTCDLAPPFRPDCYTEALKAASALAPAVVIIDSASHMHDGPGGILEWHEEILDRMAKGDHAKRERCNFTAWIEPKASENQFIYQMLDMKCPVIICLRAKEKIKIMKGQPPIDLGWQPIVGERVAFETIFTLMLTPHCKGVPSLDLSDMREPFDKMVPNGRPLDEALGQALAAWSSGGMVKRQPAPFTQPVPTTPIHHYSDARPDTATRIPTGYEGVASGNAGPLGSVIMPPYGDYAATPVTDVSDDWLVKYLAGAEKSILDPKYSRNKANNERIRDGIKAEMARREKPASVPTPSPLDTLDAALNKAKTQGAAKVAWTEWVATPGLTDEQIGEGGARYNARFKELKEAGL